MANGTAALKTSEPPAAPAPAPDEPERSIEILGDAVAAAACAIAAAVADGCQRAGVIDPNLKERGATRLACVAELQLDYMGSDDDFAAAARLAGRRVLRRYFDGDVNPLLIDAAIDAAIDPVFEIVTGIVKTERVYRLAWAN